MQYPKLVISAIELTNICNLKCHHCPNNISTYPKGYMSLRHFLDALKFPTWNLHLSLHGEPLLHPQACDFLEIAKHGFDKEVGIHTNGLLLTEYMCQRLVEIEVDIIEVSIHTQESLFGYKRLFEANERASSKIKRFVGNIMTCYEPHIKNWIKAAQIEKRHLTNLQFAPMHNWALNTPDNHKRQCFFIKNNLCIVKWDGKVCSCCFDFDGQNYIGEIEDFPNLEHNSNYNLCQSCSPSWINGESLAEWTSITEDYL
jgi:MoaA/NifB/PqqE/SkfB family radical SAM enzyme